jgi:hypothetical protein
VAPAIDERVSLGGVVGVVRDLATVALLGSATAAAGSVAEAGVGLTADLVGAAAGVVGGGAPVLAVGGAELVAGEGGAANVVLNSGAGLARDKSAQQRTAALSESAQQRALHVHGFWSGRHSSPSPEQTLRPLLLPPTATM